VTTPGNGYIIGVDIGGTFTDAAIIAPGGSVTTGKAPTRPADRARSFFESIEDAAAKLGVSLDDVLAGCERLVHGTTAGTNALITRTGADVGLITTAGFRDMTHFMNGTGRMIGLPIDMVLDFPNTDKPDPVVPRRRIVEIQERVDFEGDVIVPLDEESVRAAARQLRDEGVDAVAVSLMWAPRYDGHERRVMEILAEELPDVFFSQAADLSARVGEYQRTMTSVLNAYIGPMMRKYVDAIEREAAVRKYRGRILYTQCAGGAITADEAKQAPIRTVHSGPVSGTIGSAFLAAHMDEPNLIVTDMGGTSFDVSIIRDLAPDVREVSIVERFEIALPMVFLDTIGAGGGSIARIDDAGGLQVGPQSAGADPGPACYGRGGIRPTVTDADVVLGVIDPDNFLHGKLRLDRDAAVAAIKTVAEPLGLGVEEAAAGINRIIDSKMADLLRRMSVMRGLDPRDFVCFAYGGSGPAHAGSFAREAGVKRLVVPLLHVAPVWSAFGAAIADVAHVHQRWDVVEMPAPLEVVNGIYVELEQKAREQLREEGFTDDRIELQRYARLKYSVQAYDVEVPVPAGALGERELLAVEEEFHRIYDELHGKGSGYREGGSKITGFVVRSRAVTDPPEISHGGGARSVERLTRPVYWAEEGRYVDTPVIRSDGAVLDEALEGPLLIELPDTVVVIRPGQSARFDELGSLVLEVAPVAATA